MTPARYVKIHIFHSVYASYLVYLYVDVQKATFRDLKHEAHLCAGVGPLVEALLGMGVYANEVAGRRSWQDGHQDNQLRQGKHVQNVLEPK